MKKGFIKTLVFILILSMTCGCGNGCGGGITSTEASQTVSETSASADASGQIADSETKQETSGEKETMTDRETKVDPELKGESETESETAEKSDREPATIEATPPAEEPSTVEDDGALKVPSNSGKLHVDGTYIKNESNQTVQLKGLSTHGIAWYPDYINNALFSEFRNEWNCNVIRIAMYTEEYGGYVTGDKDYLKKLVKKGVKYATDNDMYVIIDWHILSDNNPNKNKSEAKKFFKEMSELYKDYDNVLYEICNEPNGNTSWSDIKKYAEEVIPVIRENDEDAIIIVGTPNWSQFVDKAAADPITGYDNIMYTLHFYADTHKDDLRNTLKAAVKSGLPVFVTEYGICDASGNGAINRDEADKWMALLDELKISSCAWNISNKSETSAIFKSSVSKKSGFTDSDLSSSGKWVYTMLTGNSKYVPDPNRPATTENDSNNGENNSSNSGGNNGGSSQVQIPKDAREIKSGNLTAYLQEVNSWTSNDGKYHQYSMTLKNDGNSVNNWSITLTFDGNVKLQSGWGGLYSVSGKTLTITNESYNGSISGGGSIGDVGFIISY